MVFKSIFLLFICKFSLPLRKEISCKDIKHYSAQGLHLHSER